MTRQTQTYPRGLIDLLQLKDSGPFRVMDDFRGSIELIDILGAERATFDSIASATITDGSVGASVTLTVPAGQIWFLVATAAWMNAQDPGDILQTNLRLVRGGAGSSYVETSQKATATLTGERVIAAHAWERPIILRAGDGIRGEGLADLQLAPSTTMNVSADFYRFGPQSTSVYI